jgi:hypothetical protein
MKFRCIFILVILFSVAYILTYILFDNLSNSFKNLYTSFISFLLIIAIIDSYSILNELNNSKKDNQELHKLLNFHLIEQKRMQKLINILKTKTNF